MADIYSNTKEEREKYDRAHKALMETEDNAALYMAWMLVVDKSKNFAETILNTPLAD